MSVLDAKTLRRHLKRHSDKLVDIIDSEFGFLNILLENQVLSSSQIGRVKAEPTRYKKNELLLEYIDKTKSQKEFLATLESSQPHVANWIIADGKFKVEYGSDWPLTDKENKILDRNQRTLVEKLDPDGLLNIMYSGGVFETWHREFIKSKPTGHDKNEALLDIIRRLSLKAYSSLIKCLRVSNQGHVADILEFGGAVVPVHATLEAGNLDETETNLVTRMHELLCSNTTTVVQENRVLAALELRVISVRRGESIVLYVKCRKEEEFNRLCKVIDNMEMKETLETLFNLLLHETTIKVLVVTIFEDDLTRTKKRFAEKLRNKRIHDRVVDMYKEFVSEADPKNVFDFLIQKRVISIKQKQEITNKVTTKDRCRALLDHLFSSSNDESFIVLREALKDHYRWIVERIDHCEAENETANTLDATILLKEKQRNKRIRDKVDDMYKEFVSEVDPTNVFDLLIQKRVISIKQKQGFMNEVTTKDRCRALLDHLFSCSHEESFIILREALEDQYHLIVERIDQRETENETANLLYARKKSGSTSVDRETYDQLAKCCVCLEPYTDPRILPCLHSACLKCFEGMQCSRNKKPGEILTCPLCRRPFKIPLEGMAGLESNIFIENLIKVKTTFNEI